MIDKNSSRYPYTIACDFVRGFATDFNETLGMQLPTLSRGQASQVMHAFEAVFGITHEEMAKKLADYSIEQESKRLLG